MKVGGSGSTSPVAGGGAAAAAAGRAGGSGAAEALTLVTRAERGVFSSVSIDTPLELDGYSSRFLVVPLCFGHLNSPEPRKFVAAALSNQPLSIETVELPPAQLATSMIEIALHHGEKQTLLNHPMLGPMLNLYTVDDEAGYALVAENPTQFRVRVEVDASERTRGFTSSRGALFCQDVLPPRSRQLIIVLSLSMKTKSHSLSMQFGGGRARADRARARWGGPHPLPRGAGRPRASPRAAAHAQLGACRDGLAAAAGLGGSGRRGSSRVEHPEPDEALNAPSSSEGGHSGEGGCECCEES
jgi:hypothetical protein